MKKIIIYLVSDSTGETVSGVARSALAHFEEIEVEEHVFPLIRNKKQLEEIEKTIAERHGVLLYTVVSEEIREELKMICDRLHAPCIAVLEPIIAELSKYIDSKLSSRPGRQHELNSEYFARMTAIDYSIHHDDGQNTHNLSEANVIIVGPSRTSKTPTCIYLAYRGYKAANVPFISVPMLPKELFELKNNLIVGLTIGNRELLEIRKNRLISMKNRRNEKYISEEEIKREIDATNKLYKEQNWPTIDVTRKSVEEVAAKIMQIYEHQ